MSEYQAGPSEVGTTELRLVSEGTIRRRGNRPDPGDVFAAAAVVSERMPAVAGVTTRVLDRKRPATPAATAGGCDAFDRLTRVHRSTVYRVALGMLRDPNDAEDATQEAFMQAWRTYANFRGESSVETWLHRIVANHCIKVLTRRRRTVALPDDLVHAVPGPDHSAEICLELDHLRFMILGLDDSLRVPLLLREFEGRTYEEIGSRLGISTAAVKSRLHRARRIVASSMSDWA